MGSWPLVTESALSLLLVCALSSVAHSAGVIARQTDMGDVAVDSRAVTVSIQDVLPVGCRYEPNNPEWIKHWAQKGYVAYLFFDGEPYRVMPPHSGTVANSHDYTRASDWSAIQACMDRSRNLAPPTASVADGPKGRRTRRKRDLADRREAVLLPTPVPTMLRCPPDFADGFMRSITVTTYPSLLMDTQRFAELVRATHAEMHAYRDDRPMPLHVHSTSDSGVTMSLLSEWGGSAQTSVWHYRRGRSLGISLTFHISMRYSRPGMVDTYKPYIRSKIETWVRECEHIAEWLLEENDPLSDASAFCARATA